LRYVTAGRDKLKIVFIAGGVLINCQVFRGLKKIPLAAKRRNAFVVAFDIAYKLLKTGVAVIQFCNYGEGKIFGILGVRDRGAEKQDGA